MPYLDSFVKETARLSPGPIRKPARCSSISDKKAKGMIPMSGTNAKLPNEVSAPRTVMRPYRSQDGYHVPAGNWLAVPQLSLMRDESIWPRASAFEGFRFVDEKTGTSKSRLTHPSYEFPFWGSIQHAW